MTITRQHIADRVYQRTTFNRDQSKAIVDRLVSVILDSLASGEDLLISGFGKFQVREKRPRNGRNPQTRQSMVLRARRVVTFKCSGHFKRRLNQDQDWTEE